MTRPEAFDLDALEIEAEAAESFVFTWDGNSFTLPTLAQMEWRVQSAYMDSNRPIEERLALMLGDEQYEAFCAKPMSSARMNKLIDAWLAFQGTSKGKSRASTGS